MGVVTVTVTVAADAGSTIEAASEVASGVCDGVSSKEAPAPTLLSLPNPETDIA